MPKEIQRLAPLTEVPIPRTSINKTMANKKILACHFSH